MFLFAVYSGKGPREKEESSLPWYLLIVLSCTANHSLTAEIQLICEDSENAVFVEGVDNLRCNCYRLGNSKTTFEWTFVHATGQREPLAACYGENNCTSYAPSDVTVTLDESSSYLFITTLTSRFSGVVTCTQINDTFRGSANYTVRLKRVSIGACNGAIDLLEGSYNGDISCVFSPYTPNMVTWTVATHRGPPVRAGQCSIYKNFKSNCTSLLSPNITLNAEKTYSTINFASNYVYRDMAAVVCSVSFPNSTGADNCYLDVYHPATVENCSIDISHHNWSLTFSCDVNRMFDSDGQYQFSLIDGFMLLKNGQLMEASGDVFAGYRSCRQFLIFYTNSTDKRMYYRGRVMYSWPLSPYPGTFKSVAFQTNHGSRSELDFQDGINISLPVRPTHNCSDVTTPCFCSTETLGSPAGRLLWLIGNTTAAVGDYGVKELLFPSDNLTNGEDTIVATCHLDWIQTLTCLQPAVFRRPRSDKYRLLTITSWTLLAVVVIFDTVFVVILVRLGRHPEHSCKNSSKEQEDELQH